jgi:hypothetical protein
VSQNAGKTFVKLNDRNIGQFAAYLLLAGANSRYGLLVQPVHLTRIADYDCIDLLTTRIIHKPREQAACIYRKQRISRYAEHIRNG